MSDEDVLAAARSVQAAGYAAADVADGVTAVDPWGTRAHVRAER